MKFSCLRLKTIFKRQRINNVDTPLTIFLKDDGPVDGDTVIIKVYQEGSPNTPAYTSAVIALTPTYTPYSILGLGPGVSSIRVTGVSRGGVLGIPVRLKFEPTHVISTTAPEYTVDVIPNLEEPLVTAKFFQVVISQSKYAVAANHIRDAQNGIASAFQVGGPAPRVLTYRFNRQEARNIRVCSTRRYRLPRLSTEDRDEYPFASTFENNGANASVRAINAVINRTAGTDYGNQIFEENLLRGENFEVVIGP
ncbi:NucA/NucB deoxyribonuclease domain-containing protein [Candidatus Cyanaurora vandensis]|uniref:NucA/NucB deoxyribonuclease domain-containing protein n=1 Tax=Candidatus Cyanaurora vandensis TaxID=2714958 RepID=UPI00257C2F6E|nr:NucA/NucB deoxyribonuclease domain-containing protein [Candidatus Cyanaurora vandensis]